jgi:hypothetical protein
MHLRRARGRREKEREVGGSERHYTGGRENNLSWEEWRLLGY